MSIAFLGDVHANFYQLKKIIAKLPEDVTSVIQVGDFGFYPHTRGFYEKSPLRKDPKFFFIDGNHDHNLKLQECKEITEVWTNAHFVPRGTVLELEGHRIACLGGASSVDKAWRQPGYDWFSCEVIRQSEAELFDNVSNIDVMVAHTWPQSMSKDLLDPKVLVEFFGLSKNWIDPSAQYVEDVWKKLGKPTMVCGHMHKSVQWESVRALDINEVVILREDGLYVNKS